MYRRLGGYSERAILRSRSDSACNSGPHAMILRVHITMQTCVIFTVLVLSVPFCACQGQTAGSAEGDIFFQVAGNLCLLGCLHNAFMHNACMHVLLPSQSASLSVSHSLSHDIATAQALSLFGRQKAARHTIPAIMAKYGFSKSILCFPLTSLKL